MDNVTELKALCFDLQNKNLEFQKIVNQFICDLGPILQIDFSEAKNLAQAKELIKNKYKTD